MTRWCWLAPVLALTGLLACSETSAPPAAPTTFSRLVSLAPNLTELVFAAGAGDTLVGVSAYSDYPDAALELPIIGDAFTVDHEQLALLRPEALLAWESGTPTHVVDELRRIGYHVEVIRTRSLADVGGALRRIGMITGNAPTANKAAADYSQGLANLEKRFGRAERLRVFYQVSRRPLYTINGEHFVSELVSLCGGENVFGDLDDLAPTVDVEAVVARDPEVLLASDEAGSDAFAAWQRWPTMTANRYGNHFLLPADTIGRATPRLLNGGEVVCTALATARARLDVAISEVTQ